MIRDPASIAGVTRSVRWARAEIVNMSFDFSASAFE
jgi:hypothetical protein